MINGSALALITNSLRDSAPSPLVSTLEKKSSARCGKKVEGLCYSHEATDAITCLLVVRTVFHLVRCGKHPSYFGDDDTIVFVGIENPEQLCNLYAESTNIKVVKVRP
jgi:hypothetical protein